MDGWAGGRDKQTGTPVSAQEIRKVRSERRSQDSSQPWRAWQLKLQNVHALSGTAGPISKALHQCRASTLLVPWSQLRPAKSRQFCSCSLALRNLGRCI